MDIPRKSVARKRRIRQAILGLVGVVYSIYLTGTTISVLVLLGVITLAGIVVNNGIVLIDYTNRLRRAGYDRRSAIVQAGQVRLRPILMTMLTTVLGLVPMALGWGQGAELRQPMAISVIGGLAFSTLLTLILIPVVYDLIDRKHFQADAVGVSGERQRTDFGGDLAPAGGEIGDA